MRRTATWSLAAVALVGVLVLVASLGPATPGRGGHWSTRAYTGSVQTAGDVSRPEPPSSTPPSGSAAPPTEVPSGVAVAIPSEPVMLTASAPPKVTPAPTPVGHLLPPVVVAKGWATYQPGAGFWGSPSALVRSWGVGTVTVCGPVACRRIALRNGCACGTRRGLPTLIDLAEPAWVVLCGSPSAGICRVEVRR
jgi:hypothetical protein